jgi:hypothetical protein
MILNKFSNSITKEFLVNISYKKIINTLAVDKKKEKRRKKKSTHPNGTKQCNKRLFLKKLISPR